MALRLIRQLDDSAFSRSNCGCVATAHAIAWATDNKVRRTPDQCRRALGGTWVGQGSDPPNGSTSLRDQSRGWESFRRLARRRGLRLPPFEIRLTRPWAEVIEALDAGDAVMLQIDNLTLNKRAQRLSGFPGFDGLHVVLLTQIRRQDGRTELLDYDGGYDGRVDRETGITVPRGPQWVPANVLKDAAEQKNVITLRDVEGYSQAKAEAEAAGTATFAVISRATVIPSKDDTDQDDVEPGPDGQGPAGPATEDTDDGDGEPVPEEEPAGGATALTVDELRAALRKARRALAAAQAENELLTDQNTTLENALGIIRTLLASAQSGDITAATAEIDSALPPPPAVDVAVDIGVGDEL